MDLAQRLFLQKNINPAIFDAIMVATAYVVTVGVSGKVLEANYDKYMNLLCDDKFIGSIKARTTDVPNIRTRIELACQHLYGVDYEW